MIFKLKRAFYSLRPVSYLFSGFCLPPGPVMLLEYHRILQIFRLDYNIWEGLLRACIFPLLRPFNSVLITMELSVR